MLGRCRSGPEQGYMALATLMCKLTPPPQSGRAPHEEPLARQSKGGATGSLTLPLQAGTLLAHLGSPELYERPKWVPKDCMKGCCGQASDMVSIEDLENPACHEPCGDACGTHAGLQLAVLTFHDERHARRCRSHLLVHQAGCLKSTLGAVRAGAEMQRGFGRQRTCATGGSGRL